MVAYIITDILFGVYFGINEHEDWPFFLRLNSGQVTLDTNVLNEFLFPSSSMKEF